MLATLLTLALGSMQPPAEPLKGERQAVIWHDLEENSWMGNNSWLAALWYEAGQDRVRVLHIGSLVCDEGRTKRCRAFDLARDGGPKQLRGKAAPDRLICKATFKSGW